MFFIMNIDSKYNEKEIKEFMTLLQLLITTASSKLIIHLTKVVY